MTQIILSEDETRSIKVSNEDFEILLKHIEDGVPGRKSTMEEVRNWHVMRVLRHADTIKEASEILGIAKKTLWEWRKQMELPICNRYNYPFMKSWWLKTKETWL